MDCPYCNRKLTEGSLRSRGCNYFLPLGENVPLVFSEKALLKKNAIPLPPDPYSTELFMSELDYPKAFACSNCRKIIIEY